MNTYLLDTDICISFLKGEFFLDKKISIVGHENCFLSEITILELMYGAEQSEEREKHLGSVELMKKRFSIIPISRSFEDFAKEKSRLKSAKKLISDFDLLIGATALAQRMILVTNNPEHMSNINGLMIENWGNDVYDGVS